MGDKGEGVVKNLKTWVTSFMEDPSCYSGKKLNSYPLSLSSHHYFDRIPRYLCILYKNYFLKGPRQGNIPAGKIQNDLVIVSSYKSGAR